MAHIHSVYDTDTHFSIDPINRKMKNESSIKTQLIQYDHNSERFTFEMPRFVEGHDMMLCNRVEIQFLNIDAATKAQNKGLYLVDDLQLSPADENIVICSWLISQAATQLVGSLNFLVRFMCCSDPDIVDYSWNTAIYTNISVSSGINATDELATEYIDVLESWRADIEGVKSSIGNMAFETITKSAFDNLGAIEPNKAYYVVDENSGKITLYLGETAIATGTDTTGCAALVASGEIGESGDAEYAPLNLWNYWQETDSNAKTTATITAAPTAKCVLLACVMHRYADYMPTTLSIDGDDWERLIVSQTATATDGTKQCVTVWKKAVDKGTYDITVTSHEELRMSLKAIAIYNANDVSVVDDTLAESVPITPTATIGNRRLYLLSAISESSTNAIAVENSGNLDLLSAKETRFNAFYDYQPELETTPIFNFYDSANYEGNSINMISLEFDTNYYEWASGVAIALTDSANADFAEFKIYGKSTQDGTPSPSNPVDIVSLDCTDAVISANYITVSLPDVGEFRGVPVDSGGTYTDASGQQYICDYIDITSKQYVQNINSVKVADIPIISRAEFPSGSGLYRFNMFYSSSNPSLLPALGTAKGQMCNAFAIRSSPLGGNATDGVITAYSNGGLFARYDAATTADEFRAFAETVDLTVNYALATPIITPLTDEQIEALKYLQTSENGTAISNNMGAYMKIKYQKKGN